MKLVVKQLRQFGSVRNIPIQARFISVFVLLSLLPMVITGFFAYRQSSLAMENKIKTYAKQVVNQVARNIKVEMSRLENDTVEIGFADLVQKTLINYESLSEWEVFDAENKLQDMLVKKFSFLHDVSDVLIFTAKDKKVVAYGEKSHTLKLKNAYQTHLLNAVKNHNGVPVWRSIGWKDADPLVRRVIDFQNGWLVGKAINHLYEGNYIGTVLVRTNERFFADIYRDIDIGKSAEILILDGQGQVVSSRTRTIPLQAKYGETSLISRLLVSQKQGDFAFNLEINHHPHLVTFSPVANAGWYVVSTIPYTYLNLESIKIRNRILWLSAACFMIAFLLSIFFTKSISGPLRKLIQAMHEVKKGNTAVCVVDEHHDEIAEVIRNFNAMVDELDHLLTDIQNKEQQKREAELQALQAQINPHFLSNILHTAKLLASTQKAANLESLLGSLIQLLQVSMGKEDKFITVRKEIEYLKNYLNLQEFRYYNKFNVTFDFETTIYEYQIPKFLLQPILENAIIHGIGPKHGPGLISVKGFIYQGKLVFTITDDGIGMTQSTIENIMHEANLSHNRFCGIGIKNVQERIQLSFGPSCGLNITSSPGYCTTVEITLPLLQNNLPALGETGCI
ncbi:MAG TPA: sensor histidine kinase [Bacillota bacterium]|nr:sensor histidine kinase [Bacillota bacterium]